MNKYCQAFIEFWIPIYKKQIFKAKLNKDTDILFNIKENIYKNNKLKEVRVSLLKELGIYQVEKMED